MSTGSVMPYKLGRNRPTGTHDYVAIAGYADMAKLAAVPPPASVDWYTNASAAIKHMYDNDRYGCCVISGKAHSIGCWTANESGTAVVVDDRTIYNTYQSWCGPGDNGCVITDVLDKCVSQGFPMADGPHLFDGYAASDWTNQLLTKICLYLFGPLSIGIQLPSAWTQGGDGSVWDVTNTQIVGGHDVSCVGYNDIGVQIATWGGLRTITWAAFQSKNWLEECWAIMAKDWYAKASQTPVPGLDLQTLKNDFQAIKNGGTPVIPQVTINWDDIWAQSP